MGAPRGNKNATKGKFWTDALRRAVLENDGKKLRRLADKLVAVAMKGNVHALRELGDRFEGKPSQAIVGADGGDFRAKVTVEFVGKAA